MQIMAHDLKNPFNLLIGFSGILLRNFRKYDEKNLEEKLHIISDISYKTYNLLEELLVWSKAQSGLLPFEPVELNLNVVCHDVTSGLNQSAAKKNIGIVCNIQLDIQVMADYNMLKTILRNLISNAIKFTQQNGRIVISVEYDNSEWLILTVEDNGIGIEEPNLEKLFNINQNFTTIGTEGESGTGLGLLLCKEFADKHHGRIWGESEYGKGARFRFTMPRV
jgi:signal transduction histidine kinase